MPASNASKKLLASGILLAVLSLCLCVTTFAIALSTISLKNNVFQTGFVKIDLNGQKPIIDDRGLVFAPGMTEEKNFYIKNIGTCDVYYRLYLKNVDGSLSDILSITLKDGDTVLYDGKINALTKENPSEAGTLSYNETTGVGEIHTLIAIFHFPAGAAADLLQGQNLTFDLCADAVQTRNNPQKSFD